MQNWNIIRHANHKLLRPIFDGVSRQRFIFSQLSYQVRRIFKEDILNYEVIIILISIMFITTIYGYPKAIERKHTVRFIFDNSLWLHNYVCYSLSFVI